MFAISLGLFAALCWALHDLTARSFANVIGPYRSALWLMLIGALLLLPLILWRGLIQNGDQAGFIYALLMGVAYALAVGGLFKAFSLAPLSVVGPFTSGYPALVVVWGLFLGLHPSSLEWLAIVLVLAGAVIVARTGPPDGGINSIASGKFPVVVIASICAAFGFAAAVVLGQKASLTLGEFESTFVSRFPAALILLPFLTGEKASESKLSGKSWGVITLMALFDISATSAINFAGHYPNKELAAMGISSYGALLVMFGVVFLKEKVSWGQWLGVLITAFGVALLAMPK